MGTYWYRVQAIDMVGNAGDWSGALFGLTVGPDPSPPEADSLYINNDAPVTSSRAVTLTMDAYDRPPTSGMFMCHRNENEPVTTIQNVVAVCDLGAEIDLVNIARSLGLEHIEYEPEQFPGLVYRLEDPKAVCLLLVQARRSSQAQRTWRR